MRHSMISVLFAARNNKNSKRPDTRYQQAEQYPKYVAYIAVSSASFSSFREISEAASRAAAIYGVRDPFHKDWPYQICLWQRNWKHNTFLRSLWEEILPVCAAIFDPNLSLLLQRCASFVLCCTTSDSLGIECCIMHPRTHPFFRKEGRPMAGVNR